MMNKWHFKLSSRGRLAKVYGRRKSSNDYRQNNAISGQELSYAEDGLTRRESMELPSSRTSVGSSTFTSASLTCSPCPSSSSEFAAARRRESSRTSRCEAAARGDETRKLLAPTAKRKGTPPPCHRIGPVCTCADQSSCVHSYSLVTETTTLSDTSLEICTGYPSVADAMTIENSSCSPNDSVFYDAPQTPARAAVDGCGNSSAGNGSPEPGAGSNSAAEEEGELANGATWGSLATVQCDGSTGIQDGNVLRENRNSVHVPLPVVKMGREETILEILREIVRKCTNADPSKRPTARDVLRMLSSLLNV